MNPPRISLQDLVVLQEVCLEQELRYEQRAAEARERDDEAQAKYELGRKQRFGKLKLQMYAYLHGLESSPDRSGKRDSTQKFTLGRAA